MRCFYYGFIGTLCAIVVGFGLVWVFDRFSDRVVNDDDEETKRT